jgi:hypothetical protein
MTQSAVLGAVNQPRESGQSKNEHIYLGVWQRQVLRNLRTLAIDGCEEEQTVGQVLLKRLLDKLLAQGGPSKAALYHSHYQHEGQLGY